MVAGADLFEGFPVEEFLTSGRQPNERCRLATLAEEALDARGPEEQEEASLCRIDMERMRNVARAIHQRARNCLDYRVTVLDTNLAGEDDKELVLRSVDMEW